MTHPPPAESTPRDTPLPGAVDSTVARIDISGRGGERQAVQVVRRSQLERYVDILRSVAATGPIRRTHILYKANLSWDDLKNDLQHLIQAGVLRELLWKEGIFYAITEFGLQALTHFRELVKMLRLPERS